MRLLTTLVTVADRLTSNNFTFIKNWADGISGDIDTIDSAITEIEQDIVTIDSVIEDITDAFDFDSYGTPLLDDTAWDDLMVLPSAVRLPASNAAAFVTWNTSLELLEFGAAGGKYVHFSTQIPHTYKAGTDLKFHVHFVPEAQIDAGQTVTFRIAYSVGARGSVMPETANCDTTYTASTNIAANTHCVTLSGTISGSNLSESSVIVCRMERLAADTYAGDALVLGADFHHEINKFGTANEWS